MTWSLTLLHALIFCYCTCMLLHLLCFTVVQFWRDGFYSVLDRYMEARKLLWQDWEEQAEWNAHPVLTRWAAATLLHFSLPVECLPNCLDYQISKCDIKKISADKLLNSKWLHGRRSNLVNWTLTILRLCILNPFHLSHFGLEVDCVTRNIYSRLKMYPPFSMIIWGGGHLSTGNVWIPLGEIMVNLFHKIAAVQSLTYLTPSLFQFCPNPFFSHNRSLF